MGTQLWNGRDPMSSGSDNANNVVYDKPDGQATTVKDELDELNSNLGNIRTYVGEDGKLHFTDSTGADSVLPFNSYLISEFKIIPNAPSGENQSVMLNKGSYILFGGRLLREVQGDSVTSTWISGDASSNWGNALLVNVENDNTTVNFKSMNSANAGYIKLDRRVTNVTKINPPIYSGYKTTLSKGLYAIPSAGNGVTYVGSQQIRCEVVNNISENTQNQAYTGACGVFEVKEDSIDVSATMGTFYKLT